MNWEIDSTCSRVSFAIEVMLVTTTRGRFNKLRGQLSIDEHCPASSWVEAEVDVGSIDTQNRLRDIHLHSNAFFAVKKYHDRYRRTLNGWKFAEHVYEVRYLDTSPLAGSVPYRAGAPTHASTMNISSTKGRP